MTNLQELSKKTLGNYITGASISKSYAAHEIGGQNALGVENGRPRDSDFHKAQLTHKNRSLGINRAVNRLTKEETNLDEMSPGAPKSAFKYGKLYAKMGGPKKDNPYPQSHMLHGEWNKGHDSHTSVKKEGLDEAKGWKPHTKSALAAFKWAGEKVNPEAKKGLNNNDSTFKDWRKDKPDRETTRKIVDEGKLQWTSMHQGAKPTETPPKVIKGGVVDKKINEQVESFAQYISRLHPIDTVKETELDENEKNIINRTISGYHKAAKTNKDNMGPGHSSLAKQWVSHKNQTKSQQAKKYASIKEALEALFTVNAIELSGMTVQEIAQYMTSQDIEQLQEASPPGWQHVIKKLLQKGSKINPWSIAWSMKNKGYHPHKENQISRPDYEKWYKKTGKSLATKYA